MLHPQASEDQPWFWTITAIEKPPSTREQAMAEFKTRWLL
jgi:hypothetical protein